MTPKEYHVTRARASDYPEPITFAKGALLSVGEKYQGEEPWTDWFFCATAGQKPGWVPGQVFDRLDEHTAVAREDYTARELEVSEGEIVRGSEVVGGWIWCEHASKPASGWVPLNILLKVPSEPDQAAR